MFQNRKLYQDVERGYQKILVFFRKEHTKGRTNKAARYLLKCGCGACESKLEICINRNMGGLEINGVDASVEEWRRILLPLLGIKQKPGDINTYIIPQKD